MNKPDTTELEELENGLTSGFWERFCKHVEQEWGTSGATYQNAIRSAVAGPVGSEAEGMQRLKAVMFAQAAVQQLLAWPRERVHALQRVKTTGQPGGEIRIGVSRRGPGL